MKHLDETNRMMDTSQERMVRALQDLVLCHRVGNFLFLENDFLFENFDGKDFVRLFHATEHDLDA